MSLKPQNPQNPLFQAQDQTKLTAPIKLFLCTREGIPNLPGPG